MLVWFLSWTILLKAKPSIPIFYLTMSGYLTSWFCRYTQLLTLTFEEIFSEGIWCGYLWENSFRTKCSRLMSSYLKETENWQCRWTKRFLKKNEFDYCFSQNDNTVLQCFSEFIIISTLKLLMLCKNGVQFYFFADICFAIRIL